MAAKASRGDEPSVDAAIKACPAATLNPRTGNPFSRRHIRKVLLEDCYDIDPDHPWKYQSPLQKIFLPGDLKEQRVQMAKYIQRYGSAVVGTACGMVRPLLLYSTWLKEAV